MKFGSIRTLASVANLNSTGRGKSISNIMKFDAEFYLKKYSDIRISNTDPYKHYKEFGMREGRWPNPYFDPTYYAARYSKSVKDIDDLFTYFLAEGFDQGHIPIPVFAPRWYLKTYKDVRDAGLNPFLHFIEHGDIEGRSPSAYFNSATYLKEIENHATSTEAPLQHWLMQQREGRNIRNEIFSQILSDANMIDSEFYLNRNNDVLISGGIPLEHFILHGARELRSPNSTTDMRLINLIDGPEEEGVTKFQYYLENLYNFDLDHQQNNYQLWRKYFDYKVGAISGYEKIAAQSQAQYKVAAFLAIEAEHIDSLPQTLESICKSKGVSIEIYITLRARFTADESKKLASALRGMRKVRLIRNEKDFIELVSQSDYLLIVTSNVLFDPLALLIMLDEISSAKCSFVYSDHDTLTNGCFHSPSFKPGFSPVYLEEKNYCGPVLFVRRTDITDKTIITMFNTLSNNTPQVAHQILSSGVYEVGHLPFVLYHTIEKALPIISDHHTPRSSKISHKSSVTIIIPMRDKHELTKACVESILTYSNYPRNLLNIIIVDNDSVEASSIAFLDRLKGTESIEVIDYKGSFNFAKINNFAASFVKTEIIVFLNNDTAVIDGDWLGKLVYYASMTQIGAVGAKLVYEDNTIQHGGCVVGAAGGYVEHLLVGRDYRDKAIVDETREMSAVTGACIAISSDKFEKIGGFNPVLKVAWNDVFLCLSSLDAGYRNIYLSDAILYHYESKSRGFDSTSEKLEIFTREAAFTRKHFRKYFLNDPSYNGNLSLESAGKLALPPRTLKPWVKGSNRPKKILMLSCVYNIGYGVPVVIERHAQRMISQGWDVHIGGPLGTNEIIFDRCHRAVFSSASEAAVYAYKNDIPIVVSHTPPFFRITDYMGSHTAVICYDYGEPNPKLFDASTTKYLENVNRDKLLAFSLASKVVAISQAVKSEGKFTETTVVGLGNDHLAVWSEAMATPRNELRKKFGWTNKRVILNVCRFPKTERYYKGIDKYVEVMNQFNFTFGSLADEYTWVLAGAAGPEDVAEMKAHGLEVFANLTNEELADLYKASDAYMSFSKWEGYNLGIGQALAMGLPVAASNIEAHREFPIMTSNSAIDVSVWLKEQFNYSGKSPSCRKGTIFAWSESADKFEKLVADVFSDIVNSESKQI